ncbi:hypothetical protein [Staphylospora marina]|uniref:hypothetical protein n=1 Tax=Staphylospora marina TaxID=2490858 RepID=UPI000F5BC4D0|nr:hypothetical protein [Staphylospora marina]
MASGTENQMQRQKIIGWISLGGGIAGLMALMMMLFSGGSEEPVHAEGSLPREYIDALRAVSARDYRLMSEELAKLDVEELKALSPEDRKSALEMLLFIGEVDKVNQTDPEFLDRLAETDPWVGELQFEKAVHIGNAKAIAGMWKQTYMTPRRYKIAVEACVKIGDWQNAEEAAKSSGDQTLVNWVQEQKQKQTQQKPAGQNSAPAGSS